MATILVIEADAATRERLVTNLRTAGYAVDQARNGATGLRRVQATAPDLVVTSVRLPRLAGLTVCRRLRAISDVPIILLTASASEHQRIKGLDAGADDCLAKPVSLPELLARIRAKLRRARLQKRTAEWELQVGDLRLDLLARKVTIGRSPVKLTPHEFALLAELMRQPGVALSRDHLRAHAWARDGASTHSVNVHMHTLRRKIEQDSARPRRIVTVHGVGYRLDDGQVKKI